MEIAWIIYVLSTGFLGLDSGCYLRLLLDLFDGLLDDQSKVPWNNLRSVRSKQSLLKILTSRSQCSMLSNSTIRKAVRHISANDETESCWYASPIKPQSCADKFTSLQLIKDERSRTSRPIAS